MGSISILYKFKFIYCHYTVITEKVCYRNFYLICVIRIKYCINYTAKICIANLKLKFSITKYIENSKLYTSSTFISNLKLYAEWIYTVLYSFVLSKTNKLIFDKYIYRNVSL